MSTSIFATVLASLGAFAGNLMDVQSRAAHHCGVALDPRQLPDSLRRDIGLLPGDGGLDGREILRRLHDRHAPHAM